MNGAPRGVVRGSRAAVALLAALALAALACPRASGANAEGQRARASAAAFSARSTTGNAGTQSSASRRADAPASTRPASPSAGAGKAPVGAPLPTGTGAQAAEGDEADAGAVPQAEVDPLVSNGLGSPLCARRSASAELSAASRQDCETSGFVAAAAPTGNFGIDIHIDTGLTPFGSGGLLSTVQDLFVTPLWMALVWAVHALVVMLEWCFTIDLLDSSSVKLGLGAGLRQMQAAFTVPWLAGVLAVGAVLCAYHGLVRRRVAESLGQALVALLMTAAGSWVMLNPAGTIGALGTWANQASLGTLAVTARGTPVGADRALADSMGTVFAAIVEVPWCYLEFGDVGWCRNPARLDPTLRSSALAIASAELAGADCKPSDPAPAQCTHAGSADATALEHSARLLRAARTNGAIFLALPANGPARNAINDSKSLLRAICQSDDATNCRGSTAAQAEFRTNHGTWARVGGLLLIVVGALGMLLLLGFVALRLLTSALFSLLYLMLAPAVVLAPALGEAGRAVFRKWAAKLLGAVVSKLLFSFLLGAILAILGILADLEALGWWTQWLLMSAFWWGAFMQRHQALQLASGGHPHEPSARRRTISRQANDVFAARRRALDGAQAARKRLAKDAPELGGRGGSDHGRRNKHAAALERSGVEPKSKLPRMSHAEVRSAREPAGAPADGVARAAALGDRLESLGGQRVRALAVGNVRRAARLAGRVERIEEDRAVRLGDSSHHEDRHERQGAAETRDVGLASAAAQQRLERFLDGQAQLPPSDSKRDHAGPQRNYAALAGLAGYGRREYERLGPQEARTARTQIDRELVLRSEQATIFRHGLPTADQRGTERAKVPARPHGRGERGGRPGSPQPSESIVMRDAREVAAGRKRQLGEGLP
jgi:hypothetical protein